MFATGLVCCFFVDVKPFEVVFPSFCFQAFVSEPLALASFRYSRFIPLFLPHSVIPASFHCFASSWQSASALSLSMSYCSVSRSAMLSTENSLP